MRGKSDDYSADPEAGLRRQQRILENLRRIRKYASFFEWPDKGLKELSVVDYLFRSMESTTCQGHRDGALVGIDGGWLPQNGTGDSTAVVSSA